MLFLLCYFNYPDAWTGISCPDIFSISGVIGSSIPNIIITNFIL